MFFISRISPVGICFLVAGAIVNAENIGNVFESLALYIVTCVTGLIIHSFVVYPSLYFIFTRKSPFKFFSGMIEPAVTAFGTSSRYVIYTQENSAVERGRKILHLRRGTAQNSCSNSFLFEQIVVQV